MRAFFYGCILLSFLACSCKRVFTLTNKEKGLIIYKGSESLVYISDKEQLDTIKLSGFEEYYSGDGSGFGKSIIEHYNLMCLSPHTNNQDLGFPRTFLIGLTARENGKTAMSFNLLNDKRKYYFCNSVYIDSLYNSKTDSLYLNNQPLGDIVSFTNKCAQEDSINVSNLSKIYWSFSKGLVGYQLKNGENWKLTRIIIPRPEALNQKSRYSRSGSYQKNLSF